MIEEKLRVIVSGYSQASRRIGEMNDPLVRIIAVREDRLNQAISQIKALVVESLGKEKIIKDINLAIDDDYARYKFGNGYNEHIAEMKKIWK